MGLVMSKERKREGDLDRLWRGNQKEENLEEN